MLQPRHGVPFVLGLLNMTPGSFSDGGFYLRHQGAIVHAEAIWQQGAEVIDVGGESTRPGAGRTDADTETQRVRPVLRTLTELGIPTSIDTTRATVVAAALDMGAALVSDVSVGLADRNMASVVLDSGCPGC